MTALDARDAAELAQCCGLSDRHATLHPVARGAMSRIWRLSAAGACRAVKELLWDPPDEAAIGYEVQLRDAAVTAGLAAPASVPMADGRYAGRVRDVPVRLYDWADGRTVRDDDPGRADWVGHALGILHGLRITAGDVEPDPWYDHVPDRDQWVELHERARCAGVDWAPQLATLLPVLDDLSALVVPVERAALVRCHRDFAPPNVLTAGAGGEYTLLDWDNTGPAQPDRELAAALVAWHVRGGRLDRDGALRTLAAYRQAGGPEGPMTLDSFSQPRATWLNYLHIQARSSLDGGQSAEERDYATDVVRAMLPDPPDPRLPHEILALTT